MTDSSPPLPTLPTLPAGRYAGLPGRTAIVTGGATGIGEAIVRALCNQGAKVAFFDIDDAAGKRLADEMQGSRGPDSCLYLNCDLTDIAALRAALDASRARFGPASILVNNAANDQREDFENIEPDEFDWMMSVNLRHVFFASQAVAPQMREAGGGAIVNMSSGAWLAGTPDAVSYASAKAGIVGLTNALARRLGSDAIRVNAIAPGAVRTERQMRLWHSEDSMAATIAAQCINRQLLPVDIAATVLFLASDDAAMITRQLLLVNAGLR